MASSIRIFVTVRKFYRTLGILRPLGTQQTAHWSVFNAKTFFFSFCHMRMCISAIAFCIFQAKSRFEYGFTIYVFVSELACMFYYSIQIWKIDDIVTLCTNYEDFIEKSE